MNQPLPFKRIALAGLGAVLMSASAGARADPPSRVARLAYVSGPVSFAQAGDNVWENAALNRPLIPGDRLWVEPGARDEIQLNGAALRMAGGTLVTLLDNDDRVTQLQLSQGRLNVHVRRMRPNDVFEIDTPNLALSIREPGDYRIEVDPSGNATMVAVRRGQAEAYGDGNAYRLAGGQAYSFGGTDLRDARYARPLMDEFDRWSDVRDRRIEQARSVRYVSPDLIGYEDLDDQGSWRVVPNYGNVWMPAHVSRDWAPYRDGHWSYVQPWGWTWIDDAPWGYAVSHYGRWARFDNGWGWVPGPRTASPVYAPALVAFVNIGSGSYSPRERPVGWFPLAPREVYRPSYRASPNYITNINVTNTAVDRRYIARDDRWPDYANRRAVTAVPAHAFAQAQPVSRSAIALPALALAAAAIAQNAPVAPERERGHRGQGNQPPQDLIQRQALARNAPPRAAFQAPMPQQQQGAVAPAPRMLQQDRRGARQFGQLPPQGTAPVIQQQPMPAPLQANERDGRREHGQREAEQQVRAQQQEQQLRMQQQAREQEQRGRMQQQDQQARMQQQAREQDERGRAQQQELQGRERQQRGRAQEQDQQARMQQQAREQEQRGRAQQQEQQTRAQEQRGRAQEQEQQARMQQQAREQEQRGHAQQQQEQQARMQQQVREQEQRGRAQQQQEQQARMQQQAREQEQRGRAQQQQEQQARMQQQASEQEQRGHAQQQAREQEQQARAQQQTQAQEQQAKARQAREQEQQVRAQQQAHAQEQARAQQQEQAKAQEQGRMQALAAQAAARAQAEQARAQAQAQAAQARAQAQAQPAQAQPAASAPPEKERGRGRGRDKQEDKEQQNR